MKIVTYLDLESKAGLLPLMEQAFGWPFSEREFRRFLRIDPRLRTGSVGFCALEDGKVVSYVGVMDLATRTLDGKTEYVGGVWGVATLPGYTRRGFSKALFDAVHRYFMDKGYRFSFLNTSPILVAYSLYRKLGYADVVYYPSAYKVLTGKAAPPRGKAARKLDVDKVLAMYSACVKGKTGFVARDRPYLELLSKEKRLTAKATILGREGYVVFRKDTHSTRIRELIAPNREEAEKLIKAVEQRTRDVVFARAVVDKSLLRVYRSKGYTVLDDAHGVFMAKPLEAGTSLEQVYGKEFFQTELDHF